MMETLPQSTFLDASRGEVQRAGLSGRQAQVCCVDSRMHKSFKNHTSFGDQGLDCAGLGDLTNVMECSFISSPLKYKNFFPLATET